MGLFGERYSGSPCISIATKSAWEEGGTESISIFQKAIVGFIAAFLTVTLAIPHQRRMLYPDSNRARNVAAIYADFRPRLSAGIFRFMS